MAAGSILAIRTHARTHAKPNFVLFPVKLKTVQKQKAYSARFATGGMRLFMFLENT